MLGGGNPKGLVRPGAKSAQVVQETEQKLVPDTDNAGYNVPERQGNLKRALLSTYPAAVDAADSRTGDVGKRLKDTHNKTHGEQDWLGMVACGTVSHLSGHCILTFTNHRFSCR